MLFQAEKTEKARGLMSSLEKLNLAPLVVKVAPSSVLFLVTFGYLMSARSTPAPPRSADAP